MKKARKKKLLAIAAQLANSMNELDKLKYQAEADLDRVADHLRGGRRAGKLEDEVAVFEQFSFELYELSKAMEECD